MGALTRRSSSTHTRPFDRRHERGNHALVLAAAGLAVASIIRITKCRVLVIFISDSSLHIRAKFIEVFIRMIAAIDVDGLAEHGK